MWQIQMEVDTTLRKHTLDKSALSAGSTVSGYTGKDGDVLTVSIPASVSTANRSFTLMLFGMDDRAIGNMQVFNHNSNTDYWLRRG